MKIYFTNLKNIKNTAKKICNLSPELKLSKVQECLAKNFGYQDWFDLNKNYKSGDSFLIDTLSVNEFINTQVSLIIKISQELNLNIGDIQHILAYSHLMGNREVSLKEQISIRTKCFELTHFNGIAKRHPGEIGKRKDTQGLVILKNFKKGACVEILSHNSLGRTMLADYEYISPRKKLENFIPLRLYLPYGYYIEEDGSEVIFSRDYKPLWRIKIGCKPERLSPLENINYVDRIFLGGDHNPWSPEEERQEREQFLIDNGVQTLPTLVEYLPSLVFDDSAKTLDDVIKQDIELGVK